MRSATLCFVLLAHAAMAPAGEPVKPAPPKNPELERELLRRMKADQDARNAWIQWINVHGSKGMVNAANLSPEKKAEFEKVGRRVQEEDEANTKWLQEVIDKHGWPTHSLVGKSGANAAWLLVQHADKNPKFQRVCLDLMKKLPKEEISQKNLAYLTDRVLLAEGRKQIYGTQFTTVDGKLVPRPLEDEANVDQRRAEVGLSSLEEYRKTLERVYGGPSKKK